MIMSIDEINRKYNPNHDPQLSLIIELAFKQGKIEQAMENFESIQRLFRDSFPRKNL